MFVTNVCALQHQRQSNLAQLLNHLHFLLFVEPLNAQFSIFALSSAIANMPATLHVIRTKSTSNAFHLHCLACSFPFGLSKQVSTECGVFKLDVFRHLEKKINSDIIILVEFVIASAVCAQRNVCNCPEISQEHHININTNDEQTKTEGRN